MKYQRVYLSTHSSGLNPSGYPLGDIPKGFPEVEYLTTEDKCIHGNLQIYDFNKHIFMKSTKQEIYSLFKEYFEKESYTTYTYFRNFFRDNLKLYNFLLDKYTYKLKEADITFNCLENVNYDDLLWDIICYFDRDELYDAIKDYNLFKPYNMLNSLIKTNKFEYLQDIYNLYYDYDILYFKSEDFL